MTKAGIISVVRCRNHAKARIIRAAQCLRLRDDEREQDKRMLPTDPKPCSALAQMIWCLFPVKTVCWLRSNALW